MSEDHWWLLYQPTNFKIGNAQIGSKDDLKSLCEEADKYGIKIIVDVIFNHTANAGAGDLEIVPSSTVDPEILNDSSMWHTPFFCK